MATSGEVAIAAADDEDIRGDGKKKKFKPLSAVRKLFGGRSKRKKESVVAVKAQSTTALHSGYAGDDDDDDDGGFKSSQAQTTSKPLAGNRSISQDSIFSPNIPISAFPTSAVSEDCVPKAQLQNELLSKLSHRRSQYSDDDRDDGLPRSPVQSITTADVINGDYLKPVTSGKKNYKQGSEQSLISVDSSDNEDNLFTANWKRSVPAKRTAPRTSSKMSEGSASDEPLDFSNIQKTELLRSTAAKDRISIKPQSRRASRLSRKKKESSKSLPSLNEESPQRFRAESEHDTSKTYNAGKELHQGQQSNSNAAVAIQIETTAAPAASASYLSSSAPSFGMMMAAAPLKDNEPDSPTKGRQIPGNDVKAAVVVEAKKDEAEKEKVNVPRSSIKSRAAGFESARSSAKSAADASKQEGGSLKVSDPSSKITSSPREDYKIKRQARSKTIPAGNAEDENAIKVQRAGSERFQQTSTIVVQSPSKAPPVENVQTINLPESTQSQSTSASVGMKKVDNSKFTGQDSNTKAEPDWLSMVRKKKEEHTAANTNQKDEDEASKTATKPLAETTASTPASVTTKSSFSSGKSVYRDKKNDSVDAAGNAGQVKDNKSTADVLKKEECPKEVTSTKRPSIDIGTVRRDSLEINVSELNSVKSMTSSFSGVSKRESMASRWNPAAKSNDTATDAPSSLSNTPNPSSSTSERAKLFSGASASASPSTQSSSPLSSSSMSAGSNNTKLPSSGINQSRFGSVKTSPTKSFETKPSAFVGRGGSVKAISSHDSSPPSSSTTAPSSISLSKSESVSSAPKVESPNSPSETKMVTSNASNVGSNSFSVSSTRPPPHPNSSSSFSQATPKVVSPTSSTVKSGSSFTKPVSFGVRSSPFSVAKPNASSPASASSISSSSASPSKTPTTASSSSSLSSSATSSSTTTTFISSSQSKTSPIRSHSSFTSPASNRSQVGTTTSSFASRSNNLSKSSSVKTPSNTAPKQEKETAVPKVPAWRANLAKKEVKIEIIEKSNNSNTSSSIPSSLSSSSSSSQNKIESGKKTGDSSRVAEMAKTTETRSPSVTSPEKTSRRSSKVLDMVKNFQNLQVSS